MSKINTIFTFASGVPTSFVAIVNRKQYTADNTHKNWDVALEAIRNGDTVALVNAIDIKNAVANYTVGNIKVVGNNVYYGTIRLGDVIVQRVLDFMNNKLDVIPLLKFLNKLHQNPSARAVNELYNFLQHKNLPITSEGNFRAYKGLLLDYYSITAGKIPLIQGMVNDKGQIYNGIGETIECVRNSVDDNKDNTCSYGLHAGSLSYATDFAKGKLVIVEINPADVVSIPSDCNGQKLRTCKYVVVEDCAAPLDSVYIETAVPISDQTAAQFSGDAEAGYDVGYDDGYNGELYAVLTHKSPAYQAGYENGYVDGEVANHDDNERDDEEDTDEDTSDVPTSHSGTYQPTPQVNYHSKRDASGRFVKS